MIFDILEKAVTKSHGLGNYYSILFYVLEEIFMICTGVPDFTGGIRYTL